MNNLGDVLYDQGKYKEAEEVFRQVLELRKKVLGPEDPTTLGSMNNLKLVLRNQGKDEEAKAIF
jgi:TolA-binding protein